MTESSDARHAELVSVSHDRLYVSYGLHPQSAGHINVKGNADFLENLLQQHKLHAIGEAGFDYFNEEFRKQAATQEEMLNMQLDLALQYNLPLIVHCRKANEKLFEYSKQLKKLPAVLFHSFMGMPNEAKSLLARGINGYFSFGKQVINNNKKVIACVRELPAENLLTETDAPWQFLKGQKYTHPSEIKDVFNAFCELRNQKPEELQAIFQSNFMNLFLQNSNKK
jgi:TatD DNase family protein